MTSTFYYIFTLKVIKIRQNESKDKVSNYNNNFKKF